MQEACILLLSVRVHLNWCTHSIYARCKWLHAYGIWLQCSVQQIVCRHCFLATTGHDNYKGQVLHLFTTTIIFRAASIVLQNSLHGINVQLIYDQIRMVEWIDDSSLKVTLSINLMFVQR